MKQCIVFLGKTGSGKDTQADLLTEKYDVEIIRLGDLVRARAKSDAVVADTLKHGELVEDSIVDGLLAEQIHTLESDAIFVSDGYPRHSEQAHTLERHLTKANAHLAAVVYFAVSDADVRLRLKLRARDDDAPDAVLERLKEFKKFTEPVKEYFRLTYPTNFIEIDASKSPKEIFTQLDAELNKKLTLPKR